MQNNQEKDKPLESIEDILHEMDGQGVLKDILSDGASLLEVITADAHYQVDIIDPEEKK